MTRTTYIQTKVKLTRAQVHKLAKGQRIQLSAAAIRSGNHPIWLTKTQLRRLQTAARAGKGARVGFSQAQVKHHVRMGGGFWSDFASGFRDGLSTVLSAGSKVFAKVPLLDKAAGPLAAIAGVVGRGDEAWKYGN